MMGRRSARLPIVIPITIHGTDPGGQGFKESTWTICVNKQGAKIATFHHLPVGGQILVVNPVLGRSAKAHVVWVGDKRYREDPYEIGVELTEAINLWAVKHPPEDWQRTLPLDPGARGDEPARREPAPSSLVDSQLPTSSSELRAEALEARLAAFARQIEPQIQAGILELSDRLKKLEEQEKPGAASGERLAALEASFESSRAQIESLETRIVAFSEGWPALVVKTREIIQEAGRRAVDSAAEALHERLQRAWEEQLRQELAGASARLVQDTGKRIQDEASVAVDILGQNASARMTKLVEEQLALAAPQIQAQQAHAAEQARDQLASVLQGAAADLTEKLRKVAEEMKASLRAEVEESLMRSANDLITRLNQSFAEQAQAASRNAEQSFQEKLQRAQEYVQEAIASADVRVRETWERETETAKKTIGERVDSLNLATEAAIAQLRSAYQGLESDFKATAEGAPRRLAEISSSALEHFQQQMGVLLEGFHGEMQKTLREFHEKGAKEAAEQLEKAAGDLLATSTRELRTQAEEVLATLTEELKTSGKGLVEDSQHQLSTVRVATLESLATMYKQLGAGAIVLRDWTDQARAQLEASFQKSLEIFHKQLSDLTRSAFERRPRERDVLPEDLLHRLRQAGRVLQEKGAGTVAAEPAPETPAKPAETQSAQIQKKTEEYLDLVIEQLKTPAQAMDDETRAFRRKLAEALEGFQTSTRKSGQHGH